MHGGNTSPRGIPSATLSVRRRVWEECRPYCPNHGTRTRSEMGQSYLPLPFCGPSSSQCTCLASFATVGTPSSRPIEFATLCVGITW